MNDKQKQELSDIIDNLIERILNHEPDDEKKKIKDSVMDETMRMFYDKM